jgi:hypothetical protein
MDVGYVMSWTSKEEYLRRIYPRYQRAGYAEKPRMLDEFCATCEYSRKYVIWVLNGPLPAERRTRKVP